MIDFDPFEKPLREVEMDDLDGLAENNISEGMYMEYKRSLPSTQSLAKVIASFANTHGGFFLIGVAEEELTNIASGQIGVNIQENPDPKETVRNIVRDHLNPSPDFATRVIQRDDYENYALLLMEIPKSRDTPHIHSSGKIYTRTGEGSDPIEATTDRWSVNKLYQRHEEWKNQVDEFCQTSLNLTRGQAGTADDFSDGWPFLELYVVPSTLGEPLCTEILEDIDLFKSILSESGVYLPSFELDDDSSSFEISSGREYNAYRASNDAVVAQSFNTDEYGEINPAMTPESVKFFDDGGLKVLLNVPQTRVPDNPGRSWQLFLQKIDGNSENIRFLDGEELVLAIHTVLNSYLRVLEECGWTDRPGRELHFRARTRNGYRTALMFNKPWYRRLINEYGPPISYEDNVTVPFRDTRLLYPTEEGKYDGIVRSIAQILEAFGLPWEEAGRSSEILWDRMWEVIDSRPTE